MLITCGALSIAYASAFARVKLLQMALPPPSSYQQARNMLRRADGATPTIPTPLPSAAPMMPATAVPCASAAKPSAESDTKSAYSIPCATSSGVLEVGAGIDDSHARAGAARPAVRLREFEFIEIVLHPKVRIGAAARRLIQYLEFLQALNGFHFRTRPERGQQILRVPAAVELEHQAVHRERRDRPLVHDAQAEVAGDTIGREAHVVADQVAGRAPAVTGPRGSRRHGIGEAGIGNREEQAAGRCIARVCGAGAQAQAESARRTAQLTGSRPPPPAARTTPPGRRAGPRARPRARTHRRPRRSTS